MCTVGLPFDRDDADFFIKHIDRRTGEILKMAGEAIMVGMRVREDDAAKVVHLEVKRAKGLLPRFEGRRMVQTRINHRPTVGLAYEITVDVPEGKGNRNTNLIDVIGDLSG